MLLYVFLVIQIHFTYNITWLFSVVFVYDITWCIYYRDYGLYFGGGLILLFMYHHLCVYFIVLVMYIHVVFIPFFHTFIFCMPIL